MKQRVSYKEVSLKGNKRKKEKSLKKGRTITRASKKKGKVSNNSKVLSTGVVTRAAEIPNIFVNLLNLSNQDQTFRVTVFDWSTGRPEAIFETPVTFTLSPSTARFINFSPGVPPFFEVRIEKPSGRDTIVKVFSARLFSIRVTEHPLKRVD